jgi:putative peptidoglycan lipid II flippase
MVGAAFGTGADFDAFTAANQLPEVFVTLISGGALAAAFIPVYTAYLSGQRSRQAARLANSILTLVMLTLAGISAVGALLAPWLARHLLVPEFDPANQALTAEIMQVILIQTTLFGISGVLSSVLNAHQHFALPALAPIALDLGYVVGLVFFVPGMGIMGLAWGTVVAGLLHILIQTPALLRYRFRYRPLIDVTLRGVGEVVRLMGPRIVTLGTVQLADLFIINLTSRLGPGSTSGYFYGYYLMQLPETLFGTAIAIVVFPTMAERFNAGDITGLKRTAMGALRIIWTLTIPAAALLILVGRPAIALFLEYGAFTAESTNIVYGVLLFFSLRVISEASLEIVARMFYAQHDTRTPMYVALLWLVVNAALAFALVGPMGVGGLALASTLAFTLQSTVLFVLNRRKLGDLEGRALLLTAGRAILGTAAMGAAVLAIGAYVTSPLPLLAASLPVGLVVYAVVVTLTGGNELRNLIHLIRRRAAAPADS